MTSISQIKTILCRKEKDLTPPSGVVLFFSGCVVSYFVTVAVLGHAPWNAVFVLVPVNLFLLYNFMQNQWLFGYASYLCGKESELAKMHPRRSPDGAEGSASQQP